MSVDSSKKILIVDDEENILISLEYLLKAEGFDVAKAKNGKEAIDQFSTYRPHVILMDVMMPVMDGVEAAKAIRSLDADSQTSIIFLTAKGTTDDRRVGYLVGADDYVVKPFDNEIILNKIKELS